MKKVFLIITLLLFLININADEIKMEKLFEFGVGGVYGNFKNFQIAGGNSLRGINPQYSNYLSLIGFNFGIISLFGCYINNNYAIGLSLILGFNLTAQYEFYCLYDLYVETRLINKFGNYNKKKFFYTEIGLDIVCQFLYTYDFNNLYRKGFLYKDFYLGPGLFLGFNHIPFKNFSFIAGVSFSCLFTYSLGFDGEHFNPDDFDSADQLYYDQMITSLRVGCEARFLFKLEKSIYK